MMMSYMKQSQFYKVVKRNKIKMIIYMNYIKELIKKHTKLNINAKKDDKKYKIEEEVKQE